MLTFLHDAQRKKSWQFFESGDSFRLTDCLEN